MPSTTLAADDNDDAKNSILDGFISLQLLPSSISSTKSPDIKNPDWLQKIIDDEAAVKYRPMTITYGVSTRGSVSTNFDEFKSLVSLTLNDERGWSRMGINFQEVASNGSFTLVLSKASQLTSFSDYCSVDWSCRVGSYVIINENRWLYATDSWNNAGGSLRDYQHMVINHETGHWLGHRDTNIGCSISDQPAPVMQQQSINLMGCRFNPWPLASELWTNR